MSGEETFSRKGLNKGKKIPKKYKKISVGQIYRLIRANDPHAEWLRGKLSHDFTRAVMAWGKALKEELFNKGSVNIDKRIGTMRVTRTRLKTKRMQYKETLDLWEADPEAYRERRRVIKQWVDVILVEFKGRRHLRMKVGRNLMHDLNKRVRNGEQEVIYDV